MRKNNTLFTAIVFDAVLNQTPDGSRLAADLQPVILKALQ